MPLGTLAFLRCLLIFLRPRPRSRHTYSQIRIRGTSESKTWSRSRFVVWLTTGDVAPSHGMNELSWRAGGIIASISTRQTPPAFIIITKSQNMNHKFILLCLTLYRIGSIPGIPRIRIRPLVNPDPDLSFWWPKMKNWQEINFQILCPFQNILPHKINLSSSKHKKCLHLIYIFCKYFLPC